MSNFDDICVEETNAMLEWIESDEDLYVRAYVTCEEELSDPDVWENECGRSIAEEFKAEEVKLKRRFEKQGKDFGAVMWQRIAKRFRKKIVNERTEYARKHQ